ncbi:MAG: hypothetical protein M5U14_22030 [Acidimicrobiia bacterium]|nr:hypothetical protein [Acidimicrobiia bacterium]
MIAADRSPGKLRPVLIGTAVLLVLLAGVLGAETLDGTFGSTGEPKTCGSVWGLVSVDDLNAATCTGALRARLVTVSSMLGLALTLLVLALVEVRTPRGSGAARRWWMIVAVGLGVLGAGAMIAVGRHLAWQVGGA